jgi:polysaccharide biosynthesis PFTS motif protein
MFRKNRIQSILNRVSILANRPIVQIDIMQKIHLTMLEQGFFLRFNETYDQLCHKLRMSIEENTLSSLSSEMAEKDIMLAYNQRLLTTTLGNDIFIKAMVYSQSFNVRIWYPLKKSWQVQLSELGLRFNQPVCSTLIWIHELFTSLKSTISVFKLENYTRKNYRQGQESNVSKVSRNEVMLVGFKRENFPQTSFPTHNFFDWIQNYFGASTEFVHDCKNLGVNLPHLVNLKYQNSLLDRLQPKSSFEVLLAFLTLSFRIVLKSKFKSLKYFYLINELLISQRIIEGAKHLDLGYVFFPSSYLVIKPLWATTLERLGVKVISIHYSASAEPRSPKSNRVVSGIWHLSNWANSWVIDQEQINQMIGTSEFSSKYFHIIGVPHWSGQIFVPSKELNGPYISVFDTYIHDPSFRLNSGTIDFMGWNNPNLEIIFLEIILKCASELGFTVLHKKKRKNSKFSKIPELRFAEFKVQIESEYGGLYQQVDESYSAHSLVAISRAVVSKPFSTPAFYARQIGVPSFFLDPTGNISVEDPGLRQCHLVNGKLDLKALLQNTLN